MDWAKEIACVGWHDVWACGTIGKKKDLDMKMSNGEDGREKVEIRRVVLVALVARADTH